MAKDDLAMLRLDALEETLKKSGALPESYKFEAPKPAPREVTSIKPEWRGDPNAPVPGLLTDAQIEEELAKAEARRREEQAATKRDDVPYDGLKLLEEEPEATPVATKTPRVTANDNSVSSSINAFLTKAAGVTVTPKLVSVQTGDKTIRCVEFTLPSTVTGDKDQRNTFLKTMGFGDDVIKSGLDKKFTDNHWVIKVPLRTVEPLASKVSQSKSGGAAKG